MKKKLPIILLGVILPLNVGNICFYDTNGNVVEYLRQQL